ncbi:hypothetical protein QBC39DRAFT_343202, partial [Podospora conica]
MGAARVGVGAVAVGMGAVVTGASVGLIGAGSGMGAVPGRDRGRFIGLGREVVGVVGTATVGSNGFFHVLVMTAGSPRLEDGLVDIKPWVGNREAGGDAGSLVQTDTPRDEPSGGGVDVRRDVVLRKGDGRVDDLVADQDLVLGGAPDRGPHGLDDGDDGVAGAGGLVDDVADVVVDLRGGGVGAAARPVDGALQAEGLLGAKGGAAVLEVDNDHGVDGDEEEEAPQGKDDPGDIGDEPCDDVQ